MRRKPYKARGKASSMRKLNKTQIRQVKSLVQKDAETKYFKYNTTVDIASAYNHVSYNLFYHGVTQGMTDNGFFGEKMRWKGISIKYSIENKYLMLMYQWDRQPVIMDMYVVRVPELYTATSLPLTTIYNDTSAFPETWFLKRGVQVLAKRTIRLTPQEIGGSDIQRKQINGSVFIKRNQIIEYENFVDATYKLKNNLNYYLVWINRSPGGVKSNVAFSWQNYFKDA